MLNKYIDSFPDYELKVMIDMEPFVPVEDRTRFHSMIVDRQHMLAACYLRIPSYWRERLQRIDPLLRIRPDYHHDAWAIERLSPVERAWMVISYWPVADPEWPLWRLEMELHLKDMQRRGAEEYMKQRREEAERVRQSNEKVGTDKVLAAVDKLSNKRIDDFIAAERALRSGERIHVRGRDAEIMNREEQYRRTTPPDPDNQPGAPGEINPGYHPDVYHRRPE